jgi:hypothetical protein
VTYPRGHVRDLAAEIHPRTDEFTALFEKVRASADGWDQSSLLQPFG